MAEYNSVNLGRIMPKYMGDYSTNVNYNTLDIVFYDGNSYIATQPSLRQTPAIDSEYWGLISGKGDKGDKGDTGDKGDKGDTGPQGPQGIQGKQGIQGQKGDKGDTGATGPAGKDGVSPVIQTNRLFNTEFSPDLQNWSASNSYITYTGVNKSVTVKGSNALNITHGDTTGWGRYGQQITNFVVGDVLSASVYARQTTGNWVFAIDSYNSAGTRTIVKQVAVTNTNTLLKLENVTIPSDAKELYFSFWGNTAGTAVIYKPMLVFGSTVGDYIQGNYYPVDTLKNTPKLNGNNMYVGDNTYMGTNTFMDGLSLNGKNKVNDITDTDWQELSLNAGYGGSIKYRYHMGALYLGIDDLTGIQTGIDKAPGRIPNYTTSKYHRFPIIIAGKGIITGTVSTNGTIYVGHFNGVSLTDSDKGYATVTVL